MCGESDFDYGTFISPVEGDAWNHYELDIISYHAINTQKFDTNHRNHTFGDLEMVSVSTPDFSLTIYQSETLTYEHEDAAAIWLDFDNCYNTMFSFRLDTTTSRVSEFDGLVYLVPRDGDNKETSRSSKFSVRSLDNLTSTTLIPPTAHKSSTAAATGTSLAPDTHQAGSSEGRGLSDSKKGAIAAGVVAGVVVIGFIFYVLWRRKKPVTGSRRWDKPELEGDKRRPDQVSHGSLPAEADGKPVVEVEGREGVYKAGGVIEAEVRYAVYTTAHSST